MFGTNLSGQMAHFPEVTSFGTNKRTNIAAHKATPYDPLFAHLKRILKLDRVRLRGISGAHDEFILAAIAQNLRRMAKTLMPIDQNKDIAWST